MNEFYLIGGMALITFSIRYLMFALGGYLTMPPFLANALRYVPPAVLTAIIVPAVLMSDRGEILLNYANARLVGAIAALAVGFYSQNLLLIIGVGMLAFWGWQGLMYYL